jgi:outer membrane biosynthesis protein TonB
VDESAQSSSQEGRFRPVRPLNRTATERGDRRWHRSLGLGVLSAVLLHLLILLIWRTELPLPRSPFTAAGTMAGDIRAAEGGGSGLEIVEIRAEQPPVEEPEPEPIPVPTPEQVVIVQEPRPAPQAPPAPATTPTQQGTGAPGQGGDAGQADAPGTATGTGAGAGGSGGEGDAGLIAPVPRGMILPPPDRPRSVRGMEVTVWVFVNERGRVAGDSTRLAPPTPDARYNDRLRRSAAEWVFEPARRAGRAVGAWYPFEIIL